MNLSLSFHRFAIACGLILALGASAARSQPYGRMDIHNYHKPFGKYGPTFSYPSPSKVVNVLNGRPANPASQQGGRRIASSREVRLDEINLLVTKPNGPWAEVDPHETGSSADYMLSRSNPTIVLSLAGELASTEATDTNKTLLAESQAKLKSFGAAIESGEQRLSAGRIGGIAYSATVGDGESKTYYAMWVATYNGHNYNLAVYGDKQDKQMIDAALRNFVRTIKPIQATQVAHRGSHKKSVSR